MVRVKSEWKTCCVFDKAEDEIEQQHQQQQSQEKTKHEEDKAKKWTYNEMIDKKNILNYSNVLHKKGHKNWKQKKVVACRQKISDLFWSIHC